MTRETKIGLLVGLAFVLVVGILLSEHLTSATERPAAELAIAGKSVRAGVSAPGAGEEPTPPAGQVPIARDLSAQATPPAPVPQVTITTPAPAPVAPPTQTIIVQAPQAPAPAPVLPPIASNTPVVTQVPSTTTPQTDPFANDPIKNVARIAQQSGEPLVSADGKNNDVVPAKPVVPGGDTSTTVATTKSYKAQAGDTLNKIAAKLPGGSTKATRDAIVALNPTLQKDPNKIIVGRTYLLPADLKTVAQLPGAPSPTPTPVIPDAKKADKPEIAKADPKTDAKIDAKADGRIYVVKPGDTLSKIAMTELGSKSHVDKIRELNKDALKNGDKITVDMKLKLPANPTA